MTNIHEMKGTRAKLSIETHLADTGCPRGGRRLLLAAAAFLLPVQPPLPSRHSLLVLSGPPVAAGTPRGSQTGCHTKRTFFLAVAGETEEQAPLDGLTSPDGSFDDSIGDSAERGISGDFADNMSPEHPRRRATPMMMPMSLFRRLAGPQILEENAPLSPSAGDISGGNLKDDLVAGGEHAANGPGLLSKLRARWRQRRRRLSMDATSTDATPTDATPTDATLMEAKKSAVTLALGMPTGGAEEDTSEGKAGGDNAHPSIVDSFQENVGEGATNQRVVAERFDEIVVDVGPALEDSGGENRTGVKDPLPSGFAARPKMYDGEEVSPETWNKVDELRRRAETRDPNSEETRGLYLWLTGAGEVRELTDVDLLRFVMFRHGDVEDAWQQLKLAAAWRQEQRVEQVLFEERWAQFKELQEEIFWIGRDKRGRPTMVLRSIAHHPGRIDSDDFQRYFLYLMEQGRKLWGVGAVEQMNIIIDRVGAGLKNQDPRLLASMLPVFRDAYPDIIYRCYVAPTSWIFRLVWAIGARLVDDRQRKRVLLLLHKWQSRLLEDFDAGILPVHLGGTLKAYPPQQQPPISVRSESSTATFEMKNV